jgi:hypothetical protein
MKKEVVIATYKEPDLNWIKEIPEEWHRTIYRATDGLNKETPAMIGDLPIIKIPNGGREAGQYLWHIINRRESLADVTLFLQGDFWRHLKMSTIESISDEDPRQMAYLNIPKENEHIEGITHHEGGMAEKFHKTAWVDHAPKAGSFQVGAQIWVKKELILSVPEEVFKRYYAQRNEGHFAHILEATWHSVFGIYNKPSEE